MLVLNESTPGNPLLLHDEPIYYDGKIVGETTSGNYSFLYNKNIAYGYVDINLQYNISDATFEIEVAKKKYKASILTTPLHDPQNTFAKN